MILNTHIKTITQNKLRQENTGVMSSSATSVDGPNGSSWATCHEPMWTKYYMFWWFFNPRFHLEWSKWII